MSGISTLDILIFVIYFVLVAGYGYWVYNKKKKATVSASHDYFLAEGSLTWWAIGASLIASNISAEQFIGMSGNGYFVGIASLPSGLCRCILRIRSTPCRSS